MNLSRVVALSAVALLVAVSCGTPLDEGPEPRSAPGSRPSTPDSPITMTPEPGSSVHDVEDGPQRVRPRPGMSDLRPVPWERARPSSDGRTLWITFWSGVEPCNVLDHVDIDYGRRRLTVTLYEGSDPQEPDAVCIEIALRKQVKVQLDEPLAGRKLVDGADTEN